MWRWDDLESEWRDLTEATVQAGGLVPTVAVAYYGEQPIAIIEGPPLCLEDADQAIGVFDRALTPLRPDRVAVGWQAFHTGEGEGFEQFASEDGLIHGVQLTRGVRSAPGTIRWWTTNLFYQRVGGDVTNWFGELKTWDVEEIADPYPRKLKCMLADDRDERLLVRPYLVVPDEPYLTALHPDLVAALESVDGSGPVRLHDRSGRACAPATRHGPRRRSDGGSTRHEH
jgi:hypothetical protein